jgi:HlyD family secretion protein
VIRKKRFVIAALLVVVAAGALFFWARSGGEKGEGLRTEPVDRGDVQATVTATGTISAVTTVQVGSQVSGIVSKLYADWNSPVKKGQLLAELDPTPFQQQVDQRRADRLKAEVDKSSTEIAFHRQERLLAEQLAAQSDYDSAKAAFDGSKAGVAQATAALKQAETNLSYAKIFSPIDGVVVARQYDIGQTVAASFQAPTLFTIAEDLKKMQVQADVDQSDIGRVTEGQTVRFTVDAYPDETFSGKISQIRLNATQNQNVVTYPVIVDVPNPDERLKPKMTADVTIEVARVAGVLRIPNAALRFQPMDTGTGAGGTRRAAVSTGSRAGAGAGGGSGAGGGTGGSPGGGAFAGERPQRNGPHAGAGHEAGQGQAPSPAHPEGQAPGQGPGSTVYVVEAGGRSRPVTVHTGISDGRYTAIVSGDLHEGDRVAVGYQTAKSEAGGAFPGMGGPGGGRAPGGRRM